MKRKRETEIKERELVQNGRNCFRIRQGGKNGQEFRKEDQIRNG